MKREFAQALLLSVTKDPDELALARVRVRVRATPPPGQAWLGLGLRSPWTSVVRVRVS